MKSPEEIKREIKRLEDSINTSNKNILSSQHEVEHDILLRVRSNLMERLHALEWVIDDE